MSRTCLFLVGISLLPHPTYFLPTHSFGSGVLRSRFTTPSPSKTSSCFWPSTLIHHPLRPLRYMTLKGPNQKHTHVTFPALSVCILRSMIPERYQCNIIHRLGLTPEECHLLTQTLYYSPTIKLDARERFRPNFCPCGSLVRSLFYCTAYCCPPPLPLLPLFQHRSSGSPHPRSSGLQRDTTNVEPLTHTPKPSGVSSRYGPHYGSMASHVRRIGPVGCYTILSSPPQKTAPC